MQHALRHCRVDLFLLSTSFGLFPCYKEHTQTRHRKMGRGVMAGYRHSSFSRRISTSVNPPKSPHYIYIYIYINMCEVYPILYASSCDGYVFTQSNDSVLQIIRNLVLIHSYCFVSFFAKNTPKYSLILMIVGYIVHRNLPSVS